MASGYHAGARGRLLFEWTFILADVSFAIIGVDFFVQSPPSPESTGRCGGDAAAESAASPAAPPPLSLEWLKAFLAEFEDVVCPSKVLPLVGTDVEHHIKTSGPPIA